MVTKFTLREILDRLQVIGTERPEDQAIIIDVLNIITNHIKLMDQLKRVAPKEADRILEVQNATDVLFDPK